MVYCVKLAASIQLNSLAQQHSIGMGKYGVYVLVQQCMLLVNTLHWATNPPRYLILLPGC